MIALDNIIPKILMVESIVAIAIGELTNTFSDAGPFPQIEINNPNNSSIPKYDQVAGLLSR
jgi:hypothetical protein